MVKNTATQRWDEFSKPGENKESQKSPTSTLENSPTYLKIVASGDFASTIRTPVAIWDFVDTFLEIMLFLSL